MLEDYFMAADGRRQFSLVETAFSDLFLLAFQGTVYFASLAGPAWLCWACRGWHPLLLLLLFLAAWPLGAFTFTVAIVLLKRLVIGTIPIRGRYRLNSPKLRRFWAGTLLVETAMRSPFRPLISHNTLLCRLYYRGLGARIGAEFKEAMPHVSEPWAFTAGRNVIVGHGTEISAHRMERGIITLEPVELGDDVVVGSHARIYPGVKAGNGAQIGVGSVVLSGTVIGPGESWSGNPARKSDPFRRVRPVREDAGEAAEPPQGEASVVQGAALQGAWGKAPAPDCRCSETRA